MTTAVPAAATQCPCIAVASQPVGARAAGVWPARSSSTCPSSTCPSPWPPEPAVDGRVERAESSGVNFALEDFHHRNYLAVGDQVTGVFDWELAWVGDWRVDLVNLACWASWVPWQIPPAAGHVIVERAVAECTPALLALFTAFHTLRALDFNVREHPDRVLWQLETVDQTTRPWLNPS